MKDGSDLGTRYKGSTDAEQEPLGVTVCWNQFTRACFQCPEGLKRGDFRPWCFSGGYKVPECVGKKIYAVFLEHRFPRLTPKEQEHHAFFGGTSPCYHVPPGHGSQCVGSHRSPPYYRRASYPQAPPEVSDSTLLLSSHDDMGKMCFLIIISCQHRQNFSLGKAFCQKSHSLTASVC